MVQQTYIPPERGGRGRGENARPYGTFSIPSLLVCLLLLLPVRLLRTSALLERGHRDLRWCCTGMMRETALLALPGASRTSGVVTGQNRFFWRSPIPRHANFSDTNSPSTTSALAPFRANRARDSAPHRLLAAATTKVRSTWHSFCFSTHTGLCVRLCCVDCVCILSGGLSP